MNSPVAGAPHLVYAAFGGSRTYHGSRGAALLMCLLILIVVSMLGTSAAQLALMGEHSARNDRDRQIAFQSAEAALMDAEMDIENSPDPVHSRSSLFASGELHKFIDSCGSGEENIHLGLCSRAPDGSVVSWLAVDFLDADPVTAKSVPYGKFTGQSFQVGAGSLPARLPRYVIESMPYPISGHGADLGAQTYFYRITALGFGMQETTHVALQTFYRKEH